jgi:hypothetical protein
MDESQPEPERIPAPPEPIPAPPAPVPAPPGPTASQPPGPASQWVPAGETQSNSTIAWVALAIAIIVLVAIVGLIFLGGRVSQILSSIGTSV